MFPSNKGTFTMKCMVSLWIMPGTIFFWEVQVMNTPTVQPILLVIAVTFGSAIWLY